MPVKACLAALREVVGGGEEAVGPFLGELAGFAECDRHVRPADLQFGQPVGGRSVGPPR